MHYEGQSLNSICVELSHNTSCGQNGTYQREFSLKTSRFDLETEE
jgi:hypothetical protein